MNRLTFILIAFIPFSNCDDDSSFTKTCNWLPCGSKENEHDIYTSASAPKCAFTCKAEQDLIVDIYNNGYNSTCEMRRARCIECYCDKITAGSCNEVYAPVCGRQALKVPTNYRNLCTFCAYRRMLKPKKINLYYLYSGDCEEIPKPKGEKIL